ncbi:protein TolR [Porticoccus sp. W117]|uniref:protein TolR n=1 Tax=Porticoccus sp. W117 TaxID=3054777 RepID=UPI002591FE68|nr:protein TolR [Porticoccus sp. W117]MDM3871244.1 protein TolR [Porticoccus sp. W117]
MAIHVKKPKKKLTSEINVVPLIDVMLVLLIVFMVTAPLLMQGVKVDLPDADPAPLEDQDQEPLIVSIKADGSYWIDLGSEEGEHKQETLTVITDRVGKILRQQPKTQVLVWGDTNVDYGSVVQLMTELQNAGAKSVGLVTEPAKN